MQAEDGKIFLEKSCPEHGAFSTLVWEDLVDFSQWTLGREELAADCGTRCPEDCGLCGEHEIGTCCCLLEVTSRCNLRCRFCFADGGENGCCDPSPEEMKAAIRDIAEKCGRPLLQLSGGEPTLRDDLPELVRYAKEVGCAYVQLNTNGIRLAEEPAYAARLAEAGLDIVFLQFDGTDDRIYTQLRGKPLFETKRKAIEVCAEQHLGVTLVPTVVKGVNSDHLGEIVRFAAKLSPKVKGIHFQPVSYFGRYPDAPQNSDRYTLDRLMADLNEQSGIPIESFMPSRCDHPLCGFHADLIVGQDGSLRPLTSITRSSHSRGCAKDNREYVARHWRSSGDAPAPETEFSDEMDFDTFLYYMRHRTLAISAMAFQDSMNLNIERLHSCSLHVYDHGKIRPFCANYLTSVE